MRQHSDGLFGAFHYKKDRTRLVKAGPGCLYEGAACSSGEVEHAIGRIGIDEGLD